MRSAQLQICLLAAITASWNLGGSYTTEENGGRLVENSEKLIFSPLASENIRVRRQDSNSTTTPKPKKPRPHNIFKLVSVLATETKDETKKAFSDIGVLFNSQFSNRTTTTTADPHDDAKDNSTSRAESEDGDNEITTTTEPFRITREEFLGILRNNFQGIVRLFRKEVKIALADSSKNVKEFGRDLGVAFRPLVYGKH